MKNGDFVTRSGLDVHRVENIEPDEYCADFVCVVAPPDGWCKVGDVEYNLCRRYQPIDYPPNVNHPCG